MNRWVLIALLAAAALARAADYSGRFAGETFSIQLQAADGAYTGTIALGDQTFPVSARATEKGLVGEFESQGQKYPFEAVLANGELTLSTGGKTHVLKKSDAKDPLAYKVLKLPGGTCAKFDNWQYGQIQSIPNAIYCDAVPEGRAKDFYMRSIIGTPSAQDLANLFVLGPQVTQAALNQIFGPANKPAGEQKKCAYGGDEAMVEQYEGSIGGTAYTCRVIYVKRKDVAVAVMAIGTEAGFKDFGRALEISAQSITVKESEIEPGLLGTWTTENFITSKVEDKKEGKLNVAQSRSITIYPNGTFSDTAQSGFSGQDFTALAQGGNRGTVVKRGSVLTFKYDNGTTWSAAYDLYSNGLKLDGKDFLRCCCDFGVR
jgi:hypothetical protein